MLCMRQIISTAALCLTSPLPACASYLYMHVDMLVGILAPRTRQNLPCSARGERGIGVLLLFLGRDDE